MKISRDDLFCGLLGTHAKTSLDPLQRMPYSPASSTQGPSAPALAAACGGESASGGNIKLVSSLRIAERAGVDMDVSRRCVNPRQFALREGWLKQEALAKTVQSLPEKSGVLRPPGTPSFPGAFFCARDFAGSVFQKSDPSTVAR